MRLLSTRNLYGFNPRISPTRVSPLSGDLFRILRKTIYRLQFSNNSAGGVIDVSSDILQKFCLYRLFGIKLEVSY